MQAALTAPIPGTVIRTEFMDSIASSMAEFRSLICCSNSSIEAFERRVHKVDVRKAAISLGEEYFLSDFSLSSLSPA